MLAHYKHTLLILAFFSALSTALIAFRVSRTGEMTYIFLIWNLVLAWIPLMLSLIISSLFQKTQKMNLLILGLAFFWLLFYPNASYMLTDLLHLEARNVIPIWFDLMLLLSFAWTGLLIGFISLFLLHNIVKKLYGAIAGWLFVLTAIGLGSVGVYLGRYLRWNSWDIFSNPKTITVSIFTRVTDPFSYKWTLLFTLIYSSFSLFTYLALYAFSQLRSEWGKNG